MSQNSRKSSSNIFIFHQFLNLFKSVNIRESVADITLKKAFTKPHYQLYGQTKLFIVYSGSVPRIISRDVKLNTHLLLAPRLLKCLTVFRLSLYALISCTETNLLLF